VVSLGVGDAAFLYPSLPDHLLAVLEELDDRFGFRRPHL
jgi:hypothetical protein